jgi:uncharacterized protein YcfJ
MRKSMLPVLLISLLTTTAFAQDGGYYRDRSLPERGNVHYAWADVLRVDPVYDVVQSSHPQQRCYQQQVVQQGDGSTAGTLLGAVIGGVLGHQVGHGRGNTAATIGGAVVGGMVGNNASSGNRVVDQTRCEQVGERVSEQRRIAGYNVEYRYHGDVYFSRLNYDPGDRLRIRIAIRPAD